MKLKKFAARYLPAVLACVGLFTAAAGIVLSLVSIHAEPVMLKRPEAARGQVISMLDRVCEGDFDGAGALMQGSPALGAEGSDPDAVGALLWNAYVNSLSYELSGECYATNSGVAQDVRVTALVLDSVTGTLRQRTQELLQQRLEEAEDVSQIYDESNNFREDLVMEALTEAMKAAIKEDAAYETLQITVNLVCIQGQWWIVPDGTLLGAISGGLLN